MERVQGYSRVLSTGAPAASCTVTVYETGGAVLATLYSDDLATPTAKANPFAADSNGYFFFYAAGGKRYDVQLSGGGIAAPYTVVADVPAGLGDGAVHSCAEADLPTAGNAAHAGRVARVSDGVGGLWVDTGAAWAPVLDYGFRSFTEAGLPAAAVAGRVRRVSDARQGLYLDSGSAWAPVMAFGLEAHAKASLPAVGLAGRLRRVTDTTRGLWSETGAGGQWFPLNADWVNVMEFGAVPGSSSSQATAIQAAIDSLATAGGVVVFPQGTYTVAVPVKVRDNVTLLGFGATLQAGAGFTGDATVHAYRRDDNTPANEDKIGLVGLHVIAPFDGAGDSALDMTGACNSLVAMVRLTSATVASTTLRLADQNSAASSAKRCLNNLFLKVRADLASLGGTFLEVDQAVADRCINNTLVGCQVLNARVGIDLTGVAAGTPRLTLIGCEIDGDAHADSIAISAGAALPRHVTFVSVNWAGFTTTTYADGEVFFNERVAIGASGTTAAAALASGGTSAAFVGSIYLKLASGTALSTGANTYVYTLTSVPVGATFLLAAVSGMPSTPLSMQASLSGSTLTLTVVVATPVTLAADFVIRAVQVGP